MHWRIQGALPMRTPQQDPILSFLHTFSPKVPASKVSTPPWLGTHPPQREILYPPLICTNKFMQKAGFSGDTLSVYPKRTHSLVNEPTEAVQKKKSFKNDSP